MNLFWTDVVENDDFYIISIAKREEVYKKWGVISIRLNEEEERLLKKLIEYFDMDMSSLIKKSLYELYETVVDLEIIKNFKEKQKQGKVSFVTAEDILKTS